MLNWLCGERKQKKLVMVSRDTNVIGNRDNAIQVVEAVMTQSGLVAVGATWISDDCRLVLKPDGTTLGSDEYFGWAPYSGFSQEELVEMREAFDAGNRPYATLERRSEMEAT